MKRLVAIWRWLFMAGLPADIKVPPDDGKVGPIMPLTDCPDPAASRHRDDQRIARYVERMEDDDPTD